jgi:hypothetical protein
MDDGSCLAFFEVPGSPFDFKRQDSLDLHIALGVEPETFDAMLEKAKAEGREVRGPVDHRFVRSIYFRDPNGYVIELTASTGKHGGNHGSGDLEAARGAGALAGDKEPLTAPLRIAVIGGGIGGLAAAGIVAALPNLRSMSTSRRRN